MKIFSIFASKKTRPNDKQISTLSSSSPEHLYTMLKNSEKVIFDEGMCIFVISSVSVSYGILALMKCLRGHLKIIIKKVSTVMKSFLYVHVTYSKSSRYLKKMQGYPLENWFCTRLVVQLCTRNDRNDHFSKKNDNILIIIFSFIHHSLVLPHIIYHHSNTLIHINIAYDDNTIR